MAFFEYVGDKGSKGFAQMVFDKGEPVEITDERYIAKARTMDVFKEVDAPKKAAAPKDEAKPAPKPRGRPKKAVTVERVADGYEN